ncbi:MAG TPA: glycosyltransferase [Lachnospiraceae bacterium]|nr:glycosyltransferase [Lachnospiraceae bacterium]
MEIRQLKFSIIVVCLNPGEKLQETIDSIKGQTYCNYEIIVKDGLSTDGSVEALTPNDKIKIFREKDVSIYDAMNQAVGYAKGDYAIFLNCGDKFFHTKVLEEVMGHIHYFREQKPDEIPDELSDKSPDIVYGNIYNDRIGSMIQSAPVITPFTCYRNVPCHQTCFYSLRMFMERGYHTKYVVRGDYEHFLWCYFQKKANIISIPVTVSSYEGGGFSETKENRERSKREHHEIVALYLTKGQLFKFRTILFLSMAPLRKKIAESKQLSGLYNTCKKMIYKRKGIQ